MKRKCRQVTRNLSAYFDSELRADRARLIERHLAECRECSVELHRLEKLRHLVISADPASTVPEVDVERNVLRRIRSVYPARLVRPLAARWGLATAAAVCAAVILGVVVGISLNGQPRHDVRYQMVGVAGEIDDPSEWLTLVGGDDSEVELIVDTLLPFEQVADSDWLEQELWLESPVDELVETLTSSQVDDLREELYNYAIQG